MPVQRERDSSSEPPAKRRKSSENIQDEAVLAKPARVRKARPRRAFDTIKEEPENVKRSKSQDDSFVVTKVAVKKRGRPKKAISEEVTASTESSTKLVLKKRGRPKAAVRDEDHHVDDLALAAARVAMGMAPVDRVASETEGHAVHVPITLGKKRGRPRKEAMEDQEVVVINAEPSINVATGEPGYRPKRRAATTARTKVLDGYKEENSDITKKRRDVLPMRTSQDPVAIEARVIEHMEPEPEELPMAGRKPITKPNRSKRNLTDEHASGDDSVKDHDAREPTTAEKLSMAGTKLIVKGKRGREDAGPTPEAVALRVRPRRHAAVAAHVKVLNGFAEEATDITKRRREESPISRRRQQHIRSANLTLTDTTIKNKEDQHSRNEAGLVNGQSVVPSKQPRMEEVAAEMATTPINFRQPLAEVEVNVRSVSPEKAANNGSARHAKEGTSKVSATKKRKPRSTHITRDVSPGGAKVSISYVEQVEMSPGPVRRITVRQSSAAAQDLPSDESAHAQSRSHNMGERRAKASKIKASRPKAPANLAKAPEPAEEIDVDWLTERPQAAKSRKAPSARKASKVISQFPDMDLDDLLSNIASFVPRGKHL